MRAVIVMSALIAVASPAAAQTLEDRRAQCMGWMMQGYPSGIEETACTAQFSLPSPFLFKCARAQRVGYDSVRQRAACKLFFEEASLAADEGYIRN
ncbi:hypothetical protein FIU89_16975 [Roseovarius sp. THAF27]|nr:hypothetical protein [Roseovarius sp. THAF8]QFT82319.1 hypothetical protein FIU89_16975 [Roseovarius sp. THAF27]QFT98648.1 hypothetical protein FIU85_15130 [Roseovarius sp. THAF8]